MKNLAVREESKPVISKVDTDPEEIARGQNSWDVGGGG
jgi:hypothetical protein